EALVLEVEQRAVDSALVARQMIRKQSYVGLRRCVGRPPVPRPIDPGRLPADERHIPSSAPHREFLDFAKETVRAILGQGTESAFRQRVARGSGLQFSANR